MHSGEHRDCKAHSPLQGEGWLGSPEPSMCLMYFDNTSGLGGGPDWAFQLTTPKWDHILRAISRKPPLGGEHLHHANGLSPAVLHDHIPKHRASRHLPKAVLDDQLNL